MGLSGGGFFEVGNFKEPSAELWWYFVVSGGLSGVSKKSKINKIGECAAGFT